VLWDRGHFEALLEVTGDKGARDVIAAREGEVVEGPVGDDAVLLDLDTPEALAIARPH